MKQRVLINCSNLHNGGGVAVATSVVDCLSQMDHCGLTLSVLLSTAVERNLRELGTDMRAFECIETRNFHGVAALSQGLDQAFKGYDLVFSIFGPAYFIRRNTRHLFGFAQPNIIYPSNVLTANMTLWVRWYRWVKFELQAYFFSRADELVVELEHVKLGLARRHLFSGKPVHVVHSAVHSVFSDSSKWTPLNLPGKPGCLRLGVISRNYAHKNLAILADVKDILQRTYGREVDIFVTFTVEEWMACDARFRRVIHNVGGLSLSQCPTFYAAMDGVVFPSLLECFSAVPIESMTMERPLFASNLSFIRDVCGEHCQYFDPLVATDIAQVIDAYFRLPINVQREWCSAARAHVLRYPGPEERALNYLHVIRRALD